MPLLIALLAVLGSVFCSGVGVVLQKTGADTQARATSLDIRLLLRLLSNVPYVLGGVLSLVGWSLTLLALHILPLFVVQSVVATSIVVTAFTERFVYHHPISKREYIAIGVVLVGLLLLGLVAVPKTADSINNLIRILIILGPLAIFAAAALLLRIKHYSVAILLGALSGLAAGGTALIGRMIIYPHPLWRLTTNALSWSLVAYGLVGLLVFTIALQRTLATKVNAVTIATQTLFPAIVGVLFFDDRVRNGLWYVASIGAILVVVGCVAVALSSTPNIKTA